jgi:hypothetical protein
VRLCHCHRHRHVLAGDSTDAQEGGLGGRREQVAVEQVHVALRLSVASDVTGTTAVGDRLVFLVQLGLLGVPLVPLLLVCDVARLACLGVAEVCRAGGLHAPNGFVRNKHSTCWCARGDHIAIVVPMTCVALYVRVHGVYHTMVACLSRLW